MPTLRETRHSPRESQPKTRQFQRVRGDAPRRDECRRDECNEMRTRRDGQAAIICRRGIWGEGERMGEGVVVVVRMEEQALVRRAAARRVQSGLSPPPSSSSSSSSGTRRESMAAQRTVHGCFSTPISRFSSPCLARSSLAFSLLHSVPTSSCSPLKAGLKAQVSLGLAAHCLWWSATGGPWSGAVLAHPYEHCDPLSMSFTSSA